MMQGSFCLYLSISLNPSLCISLQGRIYTKLSLSLENFFYYNFLFISLISFKALQFLGISYANIAIKAKKI